MEPESLLSLKLKADVAPVRILEPRAAFHICRDQIFTGGSVRFVNARGSTEFSGTTNLPNQLGQEPAEYEFDGQSGPAYGSAS
jgi:hypothetical protein